MAWLSCFCPNLKSHFWDFYLMKRFLEIIPGFFTWLTLVGPIFLALYFPIILVYFIICYDLYWLYKSIIMGAHLVSGYSFLKRDLKINWEKRLSKLPYKNLYQAVIYPTYKEELPTLRASFLACLRAFYPKERMILVLATEERDKERAKKVASALKKEFGQKFFKLLITCHPDNLPGEIKAKGANVTWAAKKLKNFLARQKIPLENVIVSTFDADTQPHPQYFACLAYKFLKEKNRFHRSYQPIPLYSNNIWQVPPLTRLVAFSTSFWQLIEATRPYRMINFSSQAMPLKTLIEIDFWDKTIISEDSRQYYRAFFKYKGDHEVIPIFTPCYMDAVLGKNFWDTLRQQYRQKRRWAWGVEHFPYLVIQSIRHKEIPFFKKFIQIFRVFEGHYSWATASLLLALVGWFPFALNPAFRTTVFAYNLPVFARLLLGLTWIGLFISTFISLKLLPSFKGKVDKWKRFEMYFQWIFFPFVAIFFGSLPAIDAQTRMMLGKYLTFQVTPKISPGQAKVH